MATHRAGIARDEARVRDQRRRIFVRIRAGESAGLLAPGRAIILAAAQEERFTRKKHDAGFPRRAIEYCLREGGLASGRQLDLVAFYEKPFLKCDRLVSTYLACAPFGLRSFLKAVPVWMKQKI